MDAPEKSTKSAHKLDGLGKFASGLCAVHCALCVFLPGLFALIGPEILVGHEVEDSPLSPLFSRSAQWSSAFKGTACASRHSSPWVF